MKTRITIEHVRPDGTRLIREVSMEGGTRWKFGGFVKESRKEYRQRLDRMLGPALNSTVGGR